MGKDIENMLKDDDEVVIPKKKRKRMIVDSDEENDSTAAEVVISSSESEEENETEGEDEAEDGSDAASTSSVEIEDDDESESDGASTSEDSDLDWTDLFVMDGGMGSTPEAEEQRIREKLNTAIKSLLSDRAQVGFEILCSLSQESLIKQQKVDDIESIDWDQAKKTYNRATEPRLRTLAFYIFRALARVCTTPVGFYLQALAIRPTHKPLWYEFGCVAAGFKNWKWAEFAFKECIQDPDAVAKLAIVFFYSKQYHRCLPLIKDLLSKRPNNLTTLILKSEISKQSIFWKHFIDLYFPVNPLLFPEPEIPADVHQDVVQRMEKFVTKSIDDEELESDISLNEVEAYSVKINLEKSPEEFGKFLCAYFDQTSPQILPNETKIHFMKERRHHNRNHTASSLDDSALEKMSLSESIQQVDKTPEVARIVVDDMMDVIEVVEALVSDVCKGRLPKAPKPKKNSSRNIVRRSTRKVEEIPIELLAPTTILPTSGANVEPVTIRSLVGDTGDDFDFIPLEFPGTSTMYTEEFISETIAPYHLDLFSAFLNTLINEGTMTLQKAMYSYLSFIATALPEGCVLTEQQRLSYLEVYIRYVETFCQPFPNSCIYSSVKDCAIHLLAFELDSANLTKSKIACRHIFENALGFGRVLSATGSALVEENEKEDLSIISLRKKAVKLLEEIDPDLARQVKSRLVGVKNSTKKMSKSTNVVSAVRNVTFAQDVYRPRLLATNKEKPDHNDLEKKEVFVENVEDENDFEKVMKFIDWAEAMLQSQFVADLSFEFNVDLNFTATVCQKLMHLLAEDEKDKWSELLSEIFRSAKSSSDAALVLQHFLTKIKTILNNFDGAVNPETSQALLQAAGALLDGFKTRFEMKLEGFRDFDEEEKLKHLVIRYFWLNYVRADNEEDRKLMLVSLIYLVPPNKVIYSQLCSDNDNKAILLKTVVEHYVKMCRIQRLNKIVQLFDEKNYSQVIYEFTTDFNWRICTDCELVKNLKILLSCFKVVEDRHAAVEWICRMLDKVIDGKVEQRRDEIYIDCLKQLENLTLETIDRGSLKLLSKRLVVCAEYKRFKRNTTLWKLLYRVVAILEGKYENDADRLEVYDEFQGYKLLMPTKALCILVEGHRVLAEEGCCTLDNGEFLYFILDEIYKVFLDNRFSKVMLENFIVRMIQRNVELQILQCLRCLFDSSIGGKTLFDHGKSLEHKPTMEIARKVIPFLIPKLPMFDDERVATNDIIDAVMKIFPFMEEHNVDGVEEAIKKLDGFVNNPPFFYFTSVDHKLSPVGEYEKAMDWPCVEITSENKEDVKLFAYFRYIFMLLRYKKGSSEFANYLDQVKACLVLAGPAQREILPASILHSSWALLGFAYLASNFLKPDEEVLKSFSSYVIGFKMAFLLYPRAFQLHIDIAETYYQFDSRMRRMRKLLVKNQKPLTSEIEHLMNKEMNLDQCQLHLDMFRHNISLTDEYPKDISWIEPYFSGKIAEHRRRPFVEVFGHYYRCAMLMREELYIYPLRVQRVRQENFEPLEIHYRVHVYAMKQIHLLEQEKFDGNVLAKMRLIRNYLRLFLGHFIFVKKPVQIPAVETDLKFVSSEPDYDFENPDKSLLVEEDYLEVVDESAVKSCVDQLAEFTDLKIECVELCRRAFETILKRFPHYKSYYRLAVLYVTEEKNPQKSLDVIFGKLYKNQFREFEDVQEIHRIDIERYDTISYHVVKIISLTLSLLRHLRDISKINAVYENLVKAQSWKLVVLTPENQNNFISQCVGIYQAFVDSLSKDFDQEKVDKITKSLDKAMNVARSNNRPEFEQLKDIQTKARNIETQQKEKQRAALLYHQKKRMEEIQAQQLEQRKKEMEKRANLLKHIKKWKWSSEVLKSLETYDLQKLKEFVMENDEKFRTVPPKVVEKPHDEETKRSALLKWIKTLNLPSKTEEYLQKMNYMQLLNFISQEQKQNSNSIYNLFKETQKPTAQTAKENVQQQTNVSKPAQTLKTPQLLNQSPGNAVKKADATKTPVSAPKDLKTASVVNSPSTTQKPKPTPVLIDLTKKETPNPIFEQAKAMAANIAKFQQFQNTAKKQELLKLNKNMEQMADLLKQMTTLQRNQTTDATLPSTSSSLTVNVPQSTRNASPVRPSTTETLKTPTPKPINRISPSKTKVDDTPAGRENVIDMIEKMLRQFQPELVSRLNREALRKHSVEELNNMYSTTFCDFMVNGNGQLPQKRPADSPSQLPASKIQKTTESPNINQNVNKNFEQMAEVLKKRIEKAVPVTQDVVKNKQAPNKPGVVQYSSPVNPQLNAQPQKLPVSSTPSNMTSLAHPSVQMRRLPTANVQTSNLTPKVPKQVPVGNSTPRFQSKPTPPQSTKTVQASQRLPTPQQIPQQFASWTPLQSAAALQVMQQLTEAQRTQIDVNKLFNLVKNIKTQDQLNNFMKQFRGQ